MNYVGGDDNQAYGCDETKRHEKGRLKIQQPAKMKV